MGKTALVLGGGGARGAYQVGAWQALCELDVPVDIVTGTSVGALNAAVIASGGFSDVADLWRTLRTDMVFDIKMDTSKTPKQQQAEMVRRVLRDYPQKGAMGASPLCALIRKYCSEEAVRNSQIRCGIVCHDVFAVKSVELFCDEMEEGKLIDYLLASSAVFPAVKMHEIDGRWMIDGGYSDNLPVGLAKRGGADRFILVELGNTFELKPTVKQAKQVIRIHPYRDLGSMLVFDPDTTARNIRLGYLDTMKVCGVYEGIAFTFLKGTFARQWRRRTAQIQKVEHAAGLSFSPHPSKREEAFWVRIQTFLTKKYRREASVRHVDFLRACAECAGEVFGLCDEKIYSFYRFNERLADAQKKVERPVFVRMDAAALQNSMKLFDKKVRVCVIADLLHRGAQEKQTINLFAFSLLFPEETLAGYYLAAFLL